MGLSPQASDVANVHGNKMSFGTASEVYIDMKNDAYEPGITRLFERLVKPGIVVVDIGAHIGYFTLIAARKTDNRKGICLRT